MVWSRLKFFDYIDDTHEKVSAWIKKIFIFLIKSLLFPLSAPSFQYELHLLNIQKNEFRVQSDFLFEIWKISSYFWRVYCFFIDKAYRINTFSIQNKKYKKKFWLTFLHKQQKSNKYDRIIVIKVVSAHLFIHIESSANIKPERRNEKFYTYHFIEIYIFGCEFVVDVLEWIGFADKRSVSLENCKQKTSKTKTSSVNDGFCLGSSSSSFELDICYD